MINFVIVEDDLNFQKAIKEIVTKELFKVNEDYQIILYDRLNKKLKDVIENDKNRKVYIMDIELANSISGIQIAELIREEDWDSEIIFITSHDKMFESVYRNVLMVFDFIEKFHNMEEKLAKDIKKIISKKYDIGRFHYQNSKIDIQIKYSDILYVYRDTFERKSTIVTKNNVFYINKSLNDIKNNLDDRFKFVHRACIVNTEHITTYNWAKGFFILDNKEKVDLLSKKYKENIII